MEGNSNLKWNEHSAILLSKLHSMLERKSFVDITLATDEGLSIQVHRVILCAASTYFQVKQVLFLLCCGFYNVSHFL